MKRCAACGQPWTEKHTPGRREVCDRCAAAWHACRNCRFFDARANPWCREPAARDERPREAEAANACSYFQLAEAGPGEPDADRSAQARKELEALFGDRAADADADKKKLGQQGRETA